MNVNPIGGPEGKKTKEVKELTKGQFQKALRVKETEAIDPDDTRKRKRERSDTLTSDERGPNRSNRSIYNTNFRDPTRKKTYGSPQPSNVPSSAPKLGDNETLPHSPRFWENGAPGYASDQEQRRQSPLRSETSENFEEAPRQREHRKRPVSSSSDSLQQKRRNAASKKAPSEEPPSSKDAPSSQHKLEKSTSKTDQPLQGDYVPAAPSPLSLFESEARDSSSQKDHSSSEEEDLLLGAKKGPQKDQAPFDPTQHSSPKKELNHRDTTKELSSSESAMNFGPKTGNTRKERSQKASFLTEKKQKHFESLASTFSEVPGQPSSDSSTGEDRHDQAFSELQHFPISPSSIAASFEAITRVHAPPEMDNLFAQMVGTMIIMSEKGISRTEVVLNSSAFQGSSFFGSSLVFEKYASAPDSFNIHLIATTPEQSNLFAQSIPGLYEAFSAGKFSFGIGRLDASYDPERALFRRKPPLGDSDEDADTSDRRNR
ncbi:MAG: hypothetical protein AAGI90_03920 [Chlamydiota bacterium]